MIYNKEANFPYPVLSPFTSDYPDSSFNMDVIITEADNETYKFTVEYRLESQFLKDLLSRDKASLYIVFETKDGYFEKLTSNEVFLKKDRIALNDRTRIQLFLVSERRLSMQFNSELDTFYDDIRKRIYIPKGNVLALSNVVNFRGDIRQPYRIFKMDVDDSIDSEIRIDLRSEYILVLFKDEKYKFINFRNQNELKYHYVYIGLQRALMKFIYDLNNQDTSDPEIDINEIDPPENKLYFKLYNLLDSKGVEKLNTENLDEVIYRISDRIIERHYRTIEELSKNEG